MAEDEHDGARAAGPTRSPLRRFVRLVAWALANGFVVGLVWFGIGGRLAMRILAATSSVEVQGAFTDAGEEIGVVSLSGSMALLVFGAIPFGVLGGLAYAAIRSVLPTGTAARLGSCAVIGAVVGLVGIVNPEGRDFALLEPTWLAVLLFVLLGAGGGVALAILGERCRDYYLETSLGFPRFLVFAPLVLLLVPVLAIPVVVAGIVSVLAAGRTRPGWLVPVLRAVGAVVLVALTVLGVSAVGDIEVRSPRSSDFVDPFAD